MEELKQKVPHMHSRDYPNGITLELLYVVIFESILDASLFRAQYLKSRPICAHRYSVYSTCGPSRLRRYTYGRSCSLERVCSSRVFARCLKNYTPSTIAFGRSFAPSVLL